MSNVGNVTITAPSGAGLAGVTDVFNDVRKLEYDFEKDVIYITIATGRVVEYEFVTVATITHTISGGISTVTIST